MALTFFMTSLPVSLVSALTRASNLVTGLTSQLDEEPIQNAELYLKSHTNDARMSVEHDWSPWKQGVHAGSHSVGVSSCYLESPVYCRNRKLLSRPSHQDAVHSRRS